MCYLEISFADGKELKFVNYVLKHNHKDFVQFPQMSTINSHVLITSFTTGNTKKSLVDHSMQNATRHLILTIYCRHVKFQK
jgi:hypothetical protein